MKIPDYSPTNHRLVAGILFGQSVSGITKTFNSEQASWNTNCAAGGLGLVEEDRRHHSGEEKTDAAGEALHASESARPGSTQHRKPAVIRLLCQEQIKWIIFEDERLSASYQMWLSDRFLRVFFQKR